MTTDLVPLTTAQLESHLPIWLDHVGRVNGDRLPSFQDGRASLADARLGPRRQPPPPVLRRSQRNTAAMVIAAASMSPLASSGLSASD